MVSGNVYFLMLLAQLATLLKMGDKIVMLVMKVTKMTVVGIIV